MLRLNCPFCGERDHAEFTYGEDASVAWPDFASPDSQAHFDALYLRDNPRGRHLEKWQHIMGCRSWLLVERDTLTHEIFSVRAAAEGSTGLNKPKSRRGR